MQELNRDFGSIYGEEEERILGPSQKLRQLLFLPVARVLAHLGISPGMLSFASVALSIGFCLLAPTQYAVAFWLLAISFLFDGLDGVLARLLKSNSASGSFTDMFCDQATVAFSAAGMAWRGAIHPALAIGFVYAHTSLVAFLMLHHLLKVSTRWVIRPSRTIFYLAIALDCFFRINLLNALLVVFLLTLPLLGVSFWRLKASLYGRNAQATTQGTKE